MSVDPVTIDALLQGMIQAHSQSKAHFERCAAILNNEKFLEYPLRAHFTTPITTYTLQGAYSEQEIQDIAYILERHFLLVYGHTLDNEDGFDKTKEMLISSNWMELIEPQESSGLGKLYALLMQKDDHLSLNYKTFLRAVRGYFEEDISPQATAEMLGSIFPGLNQAQSEGWINRLTPLLRFGWAYLASLLNRFCDNKAFVQALLDDLQTASCASNGAMTFMYAIAHGLKLRQDIEKIPEWIPNGGNSCYIDATLLPLYVLLQDQLEHIPTQTDVQSLFSRFMQAIKPSSPKEITKGLVNKLRDACHTAFGERFINPSLPAQEDAGDFLSGILDVVLQRGSCPKKLVIAHAFTEAEPKEHDETDYDYTKALATSFREQNSLILNIAFPEVGDEGISLASLVTAKRSNGTIEREVEKKPNSEALQKYQYLPVDYTEQYMVQSHELAPDFLCVRLLRFIQGLETKRTDVIRPDIRLEFGCRDSPEQPVQYELIGATIHEGDSIQSGHYVSIINYMIDAEKQLILYDDLRSPVIFKNEQLAHDRMAKGGYIFFYKKANA